MLIFASMKQIPVESFNLQLLNVGLARHDGDWNWTDVESPFTRIYYVKEGEALLHLQGKSFKLRPGFMYIIPAYARHSCECHGLFVHYYLHVYEGVKNEMNMVELYDFPTEIEAGDVEEIILQRMSEQLPHTQLPESDPHSYDNAPQLSAYIERYRDMPLWQKMDLRGAILVLFSRFMRWAKPRMWTLDERMKRVIDHIHSHIDEDINVDELADVACVSKPYFIRLFKQEFGISPLMYVNGKKVERAQLLLYTTDKPVKEVAYALGFSDHSYFIRLFRKRTGMTPQNYRGRMRK